MVGVPGNAFSGLRRLTLGAALGHSQHIDGNRFGFMDAPSTETCPREALAAWGP
jgi:hypothetical protein